jgi:RimJ/RimL family protein N-acetyltransferase
MGVVNGDVTLEGQWIRLTPLATEHVPGLLAAATEDRSTYRFTPVPATLDELERYVAAALADRARGWSLPFAVVRLADGEVVGSTRFLEIDDWAVPMSPPGPVVGRVRAGPPRALEIGATWYRASAQRTPVNTEAKLLLLDFAFEQWCVERVSFKTDERNVRSRRAIERLGATFEGVRRAHLLGADGEIRSSAYYSILRGEWPEVRRRLQARLTAPS